MTQYNFFTASDQIATAQGLWVIHGDDSILSQQLLGQFRSSWLSKNIERQRIDATHVNDWSEAIGLLHNQSLFSSLNAIEVHGNIKPDAKQVAKLSQFAALPDGHIVLCVMPKQDKKALAVDFFNCAHVINTTLQNDNDRTRFLKLEVTRLKLNVDASIWVGLLENTQNNLLAAQQVLLRLSYTHSDQLIDVACIQQAISNQSRFNTHELSDVILQGNSAKALSILSYLEQTNEPPTTVLWSLAKDMRILMQGAASPNRIADICMSQGVWQSRHGLYASALRRISSKQTTQWARLVLEIDESIKGAFHANPWQLIQTAVLLICGVQLAF